MRMPIGDIARAVGARLEGAAEAEATGVTWDSRAVRPGDLYVALPGERVDGHDFAPAAVEAGAVAVLVQRPVDVAVPALVVDDAQAALADLARAWRDCLEGVVVGLTGSSGKTSTKNLVRDVLAARMSVVATKANQNNELGVPNTLLAADRDTCAVVVEMGMRGLGQIAELCDVARPDWGLVTNVGESHIELLGSRDNIARAKAELFEALPGCGVAFVNAADDCALSLEEYGKLRGRGIQVVYYDGFGNERPAVLDTPEGAGTPYVWATDIRLSAEGRPSFTLHAANVPAANVGARGAFEPLWTTTDEVPCTLEVLGAHNVSNACSAAAVGLVAGMTLRQCADALAASQPEQGRQQVLRAALGATVVDDSYNANPDSMRASLATFGALQVEGARMAVLGDMLELGDFSRECHRRVGGYAAAAGLDLLVCVGPLSAHMADAAVEAGMAPDRVLRAATAQEALDLVLPRVAAGDAVLVKASHSIGLERVAEGLVV